MKGPPYQIGVFIDGNTHELHVRSRIFSTKFSPGGGQEARGGQAGPGGPQDPRNIVVLVFIVFFFVLFYTLVQLAVVSIC